MSTEETKLYGLLYIDAQSKDVQSNKTVDPGKPIDPDIYILCASFCSKSFRAAGVVFRIITNNEEYLRRRLESLGLDDNVVFGYDFSLIVPRKIPFYAAHFKLDLFRAFGRGIFGERIGLIDLDTVLLRSLPPTECLAVYDISDQVFPAYGRLRIASDLELVSGRHLPDPRWYGGEFVIGSAAEFAIISQYIDSCWAKYVENISSVHHVSDEMVMSTALNMARADGVQLVDYGQDKVVARWWTARTSHKQAAFDLVKEAALLHLPADKVFLAKQAANEFNPENFLLRFRRYAQKKIVNRAIVGAGALLLGGSTKFTPRLTSK
jgi:hypothetical protein